MAVHEHRPKKIGFVVKRSLILILCLMPGSPAWAGFNEALLAYARGDYATAVREWTHLADQGSAAAQYNLGIMYGSGQGVARDETKALSWYRKAAEQNLAKAQYYLGNMYATGQGVPRDDAEALRWYRKAAEQGLTRAQYNLGVIYGNGRGVPQDYIQAHLWFDLAATGGDPDARSNRDILAGHMPSPQIAKAKELAREWRTRFRQRDGK